jgi:glycosyltransferase involved in cell wall biosynthesis
VNLLGDIAWPRRHIMWAARQAREIVTVSSALSDRLVSLGVNADKISVVRNGVDMDTFAPVDRNESRMRLGVESGPLIASIGNLVSEKGHEIVIDALGEMPGLQLVIVGDGPDRRLLESRIANRGLSERAKVLPARSQAELKWVYGAADAIVIASSREGLPNVLLEAIACGTPVVAARVGGIPEVVTEPVAGRLVDERTPNAFAGAIREVLTAPPSRGATRQFAARFDWATSARGHLAALERAIGKGASAERGLPAQKEIGA